MDFVVFFLMKKINWAINKNIFGNPYRCNFLFRFKINNVLSTTLVLLLCSLGFSCWISAIVNPYSSMTIKIILAGCTCLSAAYGVSGIYQQPSGHRSERPNNILGKLNYIPWEQRLFISILSMIVCVIIHNLTRV